MTTSEVDATVSQEISLALNRVLPWFELPTHARTWLPTQGRWSIDEILHHITLTNHYLLILIDKSAQKCLKAKARGEQPKWPADYELIPKVLQDAAVVDAFTWHRPDHMDPRLHPPTGDVRDLLIAQMQRCRNYRVDLQGGLGIMHKTTMSVNDLGKLDVYQYLVFLCKHVQRHCTQMEGNLVAMRASLNAPPSRVE